MEEIKCDSWEDFEAKLKELYKLRDDWKAKSSSRSYVSDWLFRGQPNHNWDLTTTLERSYPHVISLVDYYRIILKAKSEIETFTERVWKIDELPEYEKWLNEVKPALLVNFKGYDYIAYLRHYGFPSPLLDWTLSPYIATFFAFYKASNKSEYTSIYSFLEYAGKGKSGPLLGPNILTLGPYAKIHKRHFLQQSRYTICVKREDNQYYYAKHDEVIARDDDDRDQDLLKKYIIPSKEKIKILKQLEKYNINTFSLFNSEEGLLDTIATREFFLKE